MCIFLACGNKPQVLCEVFFFRFLSVIIVFILRAVCKGWILCRFGGAGF